MIKSLFIEPRPFIFQSSREALNVINKEWNILIIFSSFPLPLPFYYFFLTISFDRFSPGPNPVGVWLLKKPSNVYWRNSFKKRIPAEVIQALFQIALRSFQSTRRRRRCCRRCCRRRRCRRRRRCCRRHHRCRRRCRCCCVTKNKLTLKGTAWQGGGFRLGRSMVRAPSLCRYVLSSS